jgi:hypothetical protein
MPLPVAPFNAAKSIFAGKTVIQLKIASALSGVTGATDTLTFLAAHGLAVGQQIQFVSGTGFTGLVAGTNYFVVAVPTSTTAKISATSGGAAITVGTSTVGVLQPVQVFESRKLDSKLQQENKEILRPDASGILRKVRIVTTKREESFMFEMDEAKRLLDIFGGALSGLVNATCTLWMPDPSDTSSNVALKSETDFACMVYRDGDVKFGDGDFTKPNISIESLKSGSLAWTADGVA